MSQAVLFLAVSSSVVADPATVTFADGIVRGVATSQYRSFRGVPYAAPPLGKLRWAPPQPPAPWGGVLDATQYKHNCIQKEDFDPKQPRSTLSEDCLYLNVFTPANATAGSELPVMFWVHGGGYQGGGGNESRLNGIYDVVLTQDMVVVVPNYRLNVFGFLGSRELRARDPDGSTGNYGILDQRAALKWTRDNIGDFGGDASRVLLVGESAGGASVHNHLVRKDSWGLFQRAGIESGGYTLVMPQPNATEFETEFQELLKNTKCKDVACLEALDADTLFAAGGNFQPAMDGVDLTAQVEALWSRGVLAPGVPVLVGSVREDLGAGWMFPRLSCKPEKCAQADFEAAAKQLKQTTHPTLDVARMTAAYGANEVKLPGGEYTKWYWAGLHAGSDAAMVCPARHTAIWATKGKVKAYLYHFTHVPVGSSGQYPRLAHHASEIPFVFHVLNATGPNADEYFMHGNVEVELSAAMATYWRNFASSGDPNVNADRGGGATNLPHWPAYEHSGSDTTMVFDDVPATKAGLKRAQCDIWDSLYGW